MHITAYNSLLLKLTELISCLPNMSAIIPSNNKTILSNQRNQTEPPVCNCRNPCPLKNTGECRMSNVVYKATVSSSDAVAPKEYIGISATEFKLRYANHKQSFNNISKRDATSLSQHVWKLKEEDIPYNIEWSILYKCAPYACGARRCNLCTTEKHEILRSDPEKTLNKRTELIGKCRHRAKFKLKNA